MTSTIEWTNRHDWNPIRGCTRASEGCRNCYAEIMAARFSKPSQWGHGYAEIVQTPTGPDHRWTGKVELQEDRLLLPLGWRKPAPGQNKCFITSTSDPFHESLTDGDITLLFAVMIMAQDWNFQVLTKRSDRMREYMSKARWHLWARAGRMIDPARWQNLRPIIGGDHTPPPNVWLGVSVEDQATADQRIPVLRGTPAAVRFISAEPLLQDLGEVDLTGIDQVIVGGESGPGARDNNFLTNARSLLAQCRAAGVPFFGKQNIGKGPLPADLQVREFPA